uniref:Expressed protein n=1 Tax=Echinococcus granulosus TaxID=6210 RepID=A0A068WJD3_ECHGR|nr:expressed protein [Echinococcus granulosus]
MRVRTYVRAHVHVCAYPRFPTSTPTIPHAPTPTSILSAYTQAHCYLHWPICTTKRRQQDLTRESQFPLLIFDKR